MLLVEDNPAFAHLTIHLLRESRLQASVDHVDSGEAALAYLRKDHPYADRPRPSLIVLDLNLRGMSGHDVLQHLGQNADWKAIPVLIFTSSNDEKDRRKAMEHGVSAYLIKPDNYEEWTGVIREIWTRCLDPRSLHGGSAAGPA